MTKVSYAWVSKQLVCTVEDVRVIPTENTVMFWLPRHGCSDMSGAIRAAAKLLPSVRRVLTVSGECGDTAYFKERDEWVCVDYTCGGWWNPYHSAEWPSLTNLMGGVRA